MNILHVALGFSTYRSGGLTKYCEDLMEQQFKDGHQVGLLWPGRCRIFNKKIAIKTRLHNNIISYELINPLPVALMNGIREVDEYIKTGNVAFFIRFLKDIHVDVIHFHSFMGIYSSFISAAKQLNIKMIYTAHDYSMLCPKVNLYTVDNHNCSGEQFEKCYDCCRNALSMKKILLLQSIVYRRLKSSTLVSKLRRNAIKGYEEDISILVSNKQHVRSYKKLLDFNVSILKQMDFIHFNSYQTKEVFSTFFKLNNNVIYPVMHKDISDQRKCKSFNHKRHFGYLGPCRKYKGFDLLKKVLDSLSQKDNFVLSIYDNTSINDSYIDKHGRYNYAELKKIFDDMDVLIVPSKWKETFGFIVLEAISYGVPVIASKNVGAKYLIQENDCGYIFENEKDLESILKEIIGDSAKLYWWNQNIINMESSIFNYKDYVNYITNLY